APPLTPPNPPVASARSVPRSYPSSVGQAQTTHYRYNQPSREPSTSLANASMPWLSTPGRDRTSFRQCPPARAYDCADFLPNPTRNTSTLESRVPLGLTTRTLEYDAATCSLVC